MKKDYFWNIIAGLIGAINTVIISMVVSRVIGLTEVGYLTIAFTLATQLKTIGIFGCRDYQVTDTNSKYDYPVYWWAKVFTICFMCLSLVGYLIYGYFFRAYNVEKTIVILLVCLIFVVESIENLPAAVFQKNHRLYFGNQMYSFRWLSILTTFILFTCLTKDVIGALSIALIISVIVFLILKNVFYNKLAQENSCSIKKYSHRVNQDDIKKAFKLVYECIPLFSQGFLGLFVSYTSRYAIDKYLSAEAQACYGFISMPIFVIALINEFIYYPQYLDLALEYKDHKISAFKHRIYRQFLIVICLILLCLIGGFAIGIPILSLMFHTDLAMYKNEMMILILAGGLLALSGYQSKILIILRKQKVLLWCYLPLSIIALIAADLAVGSYGILGAAISYLAIIFLLCIVYGIFIRLSLKCANKER